jgi:regulatory protein
VAPNSEVSYSAAYEQARDKAMGLLGRRAWGTKELGAKLEATFASEIVEAVLARLTELGLLDDVALATDYASRRAERMGLGADRIAAELTAKGFDERSVEAAISDLAGDAERERAKAALARFLAGKDAEDPRTLAKAGRHLMSRGFEEDLVCDLLGVS